MNDLMRVATFLLAVVALSGCSTIKSMHDRIIDLQRPTIVRNTDEFIRMFEDGRRAEFKGDIRDADYMYRQLINRGCRYGEYGRAKLLYGGFDNNESVKCFLACAKHSICKSDFSSDSAMDSAFSVAARCELADIADQNERSDIANALRQDAYDRKRELNMDIMKWVDTVNANPDTRAIYKDVISAVEFCRPPSEYTKKLTWEDIRNAFIRGGDVAPVESVRPERAWTEVRNEKVSDTPLRYEFVYHLKDEHRPGVGNWIKSTIRSQIRMEFLDKDSHTDDLAIWFPVWNKQGSTITGSVVAASMKLSVERLEYDSQPVHDGTTGHGKIIIQIGGKDLDEAKKFAIQNIEELASRKNIANVVGKPPPPGARYKTCGEKVENGLLEIEFDTL